LKTRLEGELFSFATAFVSLGGAPDSWAYEVFINPVKSNKNNVFFIGLFLIVIVRH
jgi:hypothetical protein